MRDKDVAALGRTRCFHSLATWSSPSQSPTGRDEKFGAWDHWRDARTAKPTRATRSPWRRLAGPGVIVVAGSLYLVGGLRPANDGRGLGTLKSSA